MFPTLGVQPSRPCFTPQEDNAVNRSRDQYALWTDHYNRDPHVLGASIMLDRKPYSLSSDAARL